MSPNAGFSDEIEHYDKSVTRAAPRKYKIAYTRSACNIYIHLAAIYGIYLIFTETKLATIIFNWILYVLSTIGVTAGYHRLWTHKSYKAKLPLQIILMFFNCLHYQYPATRWVRDHRLHHKYCDTDADPHNSSRGLFYSHIGWTFIHKHPAVLEKGNTIDMSDIYSNPILMFQKKYQFPLYSTFTILLPTVIPMYFWGESFSCAWHVNFVHLAATLHAIFLLNSVAHLWGSKPYDMKITSTQSIPVSLASLGEAFHNYHHVFPWDYRSAELGNNYINATTWFIDLFAKIGWAYDLKSVNDEVIKARQIRTGDGTNLWGWDDKDFSENEKTKAYIRYRGK